MMASAAALYDHYDQFFGRSRARVSVDPSGATVAVCAYPATGDRPFVTLATVGLSDHALGDSGERQELLMYLPADFALNEQAMANPQIDWPLDLLRTLAALAVERATALRAADSLPNGHPPRPYFEGSTLAAALILPPQAEKPAFAHAMIEGADTRFMWVVPITAQEYLVKLNQGVNAVLRAMRTANVPLPVNPYRASSTGSVQ